VIRVSVTDLDSMLYWRDSDMEFEDLLKRLRGEEPPGANMLAGRAFHKLLETATEGGEFFAAEVDGIRFDFAIDREIALPVIRELKGERLFDTPSGPVTLVGKVDAMSAGTVTDYKLTERFDAERYMDSIQWRAYLLMFDATRFVYDVFQCRYDPDRVYVYEYHRLPFYAYPAMEADVHRAVCELAEIVARHVPQKIHAEAA
jgi:hypothetical protein